MNKTSYKKSRFKIMVGMIPIILIVLLAASNALTQEWKYTVKPGDSLWKLSKEHLASMKYWKMLVELNNIQDPVNLPPGSTVRFPMAWLKKGTSVGRLVGLNGKATIVERVTGKAKKAHKGMLVWDNDTIRTEAESNVTLLFADGSKVLLQESSELKVEELMSYGSTGMAETKLRLLSGRVHNKIIPKTGPGSRFEISTPSAIAAVRGTEYRVSTEENDESKAEVLKGEVGVNSSNIKKVVPRGFGTVTYTDRQPLDPVQLLDPPVLVEIPSTVTRVPFPLKVTPIDGASMYRLQIAGIESFDSLVFDSVFSSASIWGPDLPDGNYYLRIHGIDAQGLEGLDSTYPFTMDAHPFPPMQIKPAPEALIEEVTPIFQWSQPQNVERFVFQLARDEQFEQILINESEYNETLLDPGQEFATGVYYWRVASVNSKGKTGPYSDPQNFRRIPASPDMSGAEMDKEEMIFRWRKGEPGQKYRCQISNDMNFTNILVHEDLSEPQISLKQFGSGSYYIRIAIIDTDGYAGPFSPYQTVEVPAPPPPFWAYFIPVLLGLVILL